MATIQELVDAVALLDSSVQTQTSQAVTSKVAMDVATGLFTTTIIRVEEGLNLVDNTSDEAKPISTATSSSLATKIEFGDLATINGSPINTGLALVIERSRTEMASLAYDSRGELRTPILPLPLTNDSINLEGVGMLIFINTTLEPDDDETCFTAINPSSLVPIGQWLLHTASPDLQDVWSTDERHFRDELDEDEVSRLASSFIEK